MAIRRVVRADHTEKVTLEQGVKRDERANQYRPLGEECSKQREQPVQGLSSVSKPGTCSWIRLHDEENMTHEVYSRVHCKGFDFNSGMK